MSHEGLSKWSSILSLFKFLESQYSMNLYAPSHLFLVYFHLKNTGRWSDKPIFGTEILAIKNEWVVYKWSIYIKLYINDPSMWNSLNYSINLFLLVCCLNYENKNWLYLFIRKVIKNLQKTTGLFLCFVFCPKCSKVIFSIG